MCDIIDFANQQTFVTRNLFSFKINRQKSNNWIQTNKKFQLLFARRFLSLLWRPLDIFSTLAIQQGKSRKFKISFRNPLKRAAQEIYSNWNGIQAKLTHRSWFNSMETKRGLRKLKTKIKFEEQKIKLFLSIFNWFY